MSCDKNSTLDKLQEELEKIEEADIKSGNPIKGWAKIDKVLKLQTCALCPYAGFHKYPGQKDVVGVYKCAVSGLELVITEAVVLRRKSADCPIHRLVGNMQKAREEMREKFTKAVESGEVMVPPEAESK